MIKLTDILNEIKPVKDEIEINTDKLHPVSDSKYSMYWIRYGYKNNRGKYPNYPYLTAVAGGFNGGWLKVLEVISKHKLKDYAVFGETHGGKKWNLIKIVEDGKPKSIPEK